ncbi:sensor domain-containing diguanylate cyclase [Piscinibacter terrae]|uniref:Sensor domain-containing diguanylate cyclase n=1 Tax=Piscinibacter terrae TaxID=2496871 RepID=A0A3N7J5H7_9BURK|nr:sensor domain-containing diguanylate cyclase [Albitalea terrae]RQP26072.1 sensor domain-containing diguanylate cyclase [Albitalea terrae]
MAIRREAIEDTGAAIALQQSEARLRLMIDAVPAMITYIDTSERYLFSNLPYMRMLGLAREQIVGRNMREVLGDALYERIGPYKEQALSGQTAHYERQHRRDDGSVADLSVTFVPHLSDDGTVEGFFSLTLDITELKNLERELAHIARHDTLTGLPNRALFADRLAQAIERHKRDGTGFALAYLDIDKFKAINDTLGHAAGDQLLAGFAARVRQCVRGVDTLARLGGDEFALLLEGPITATGAGAVAAKIVAAMQAPFDLEERQVQVTTSVGIALAGDRPVLAADINARADAALYDAKAAGRNTFVLR